MNARSILCVAMLVVCACATSVKERGWIGGEFRPVRKDSGFLDVRTLKGMPETEFDRGLLLTRAHDATPLRLAGVAEGDLVLALDGEPVAKPLAFRKAIEGRAPGSHATLTVWRDGELRDVDVTVGRERYERLRQIQIALSVGPHADVWPFDDGIDIFGLVQARKSSRRTDIVRPERSYLASVRDPETLPVHAQEHSLYGIVPFFYGRVTHVHSQEAVR